MEDRWQHAQHDGHIDWTNGSSTFDREWARVSDLLRFHRGEGFKVVRQPEGHASPLIRFPKLGDEVQDRLDKYDPGTVIDVRAVLDGYVVGMRRVEVTTGGDRVISHAAARKGTAYRFGVTDCSWLSEASYAPEMNQDWPHNAKLQHQMFGTMAGYVPITRDKVKPGDLLFHHADAHVSIFLDNADGGRVWDTEPHGVQGPSGWGYIPSGVQIRPMSGNYYCNWGDVNGIGRVVSVNGAP